MVDESGHLHSDEDSYYPRPEPDVSSLSLEEESALLSTVFARSPDGMAFVDRNLVIRAANESFATQMRGPLHQMLGRHLREAIPGWAEQVERVYRKVRKSGKPFHAGAQPFEFKQQPERGVTYWDSSVSPVYGANGSFLGYLLLACDVTERIRGEKERDRLLEQLREGGERFRMLVENARDIIFRYQIRPERRMIYVSPATAVSEGYTQEEYYADPDLPFKLVHPDDRHLLEEAFVSPPSKPLVLRWIAKGGTLTWRETSINPVYDEKGELVAIEGIDRDVTERRRAEEAREHLLDNLERQKAEMNALLESVTEGVAILDGEGNVVVLNRAGRELLGIPPSEEGGWTHDQYRRLDVRFPDDHPVPFEDWPTSRALRGERFTNYEILVTRLDGCRKWLSFSGSAVRDDQGGVVLAINVFRDIGSTRDLERQREEFISVVAHDLRGVLTVIRGYSDMMARPTVKQGMTPRAQRAADAIAIGSRRLTRMIEDLTDISRIEARRLVLQRERINLVEAVKEVARETAELTAGHPVRLKVEGEISGGFADPDRLAQILTNLLSNAGKYSYPNTEIVVELKAIPGEVVTSVTNQGPGISPKELPEIFKRFRRARKVVEEKVEGLGLGLYITKGLVEAHQGRIWVESEVGQETTFRFTLPAAARD
ncbi:MAG: PAS domain-containing protein [Chloroflexi bacterium]|nr:PAS domain-containing protein [Chloroflexota bacterium]